jgi:hypothetical protein
MLPDEMADELILCETRVLEFIYADVSEQILIELERTGVLAQEVHTQANQVAIVHRIVFHQELLIPPIDLGDGFLEEIALHTNEIVRTVQVVLCAFDDRCDLFECPACPIDVHFLHRAMEQALRFDGIVHDEFVGFVAQCACLCRQEFEAETVKRRGGDVLGGLADEFAQASSHFPRRFAREGDGEDAVRRRATLFENVGDAIGQRARLAAPCASKHQERSVNSLDRLTLLRVQRFNIEQWLTSFARACKDDRRRTIIIPEAKRRGTADRRAFARTYKDDRRQMTTNRRTFVRAYKDDRRQMTTNRRAFARAYKDSACAPLVRARGCVCPPPRWLRSPPGRRAR